MFLRSALDKDSPIVELAYYELLPYLVQDVSVCMSTTMLMDSSTSCGQSHKVFSGVLLYLILIVSLSKDPGWFYAVDHLVWGVYVRGRQTLVSLYLGPCSLYLFPSSCGGEAGVRQGFLPVCETPGAAGRWRPPLHSLSWDGQHTSSSKQSVTRGKGE
jgi:hypothetical protein